MKAVELKATAFELDFVLTMRLPGHSLDNGAPGQKPNRHPWDTLLPGLLLV